MRCVCLYRNEQTQMQKSFWRPVATAIIYCIKKLLMNEQLQSHQKQTLKLSLEKLYYYLFGRVHSISFNTQLAETYMYILTKNVLRVYVTNNQSLRGQEVSIIKHTYQRGFIPGHFRLVGSIKHSHNDRMN